MDSSTDVRQHQPVLNVINDITRFISSESPPRDKKPCRDTDLEDMGKIFDSQVNLTEECNSSRCLERRDGTHEITPPSCGRRMSITDIEPVLPVTADCTSHRKGDKVMDLTERARVLLRRESSRLPTYAGQLSQEELTCRSKMIEWALQVIDFRYPASDSSIDIIQQHSVESISIVAIAFS